MYLENDKNKQHHYIIIKFSITLSFSTGYISIIDMQKILDFIALLNAKILLTL